MREGCVISCLKCHLVRDLNHLNIRDVRMTTQLPPPGGKRARVCVRERERREREVRVSPFLTLGCSTRDLPPASHASLSGNAKPSGPKTFGVDACVFPWAVAAIR